MKRNQEETFSNYKKRVTGVPDRNIARKIKDMQYPLPPTESVDARDSVTFSNYYQLPIENIKVLAKNTIIPHVVFAFSWDQTRNPLEYIKSR